MALLFMDSFDHYVTADIADKWTSILLNNGGTVAIDSASGRRSTAGFKSMYSFSGSFQSQVTRTVSASGNTVIVGAAIRDDIAPGSNSVGILTIEDGITTQFSWTLRSDLKLEARRGGQTGTVVATTASAIFALNTTIYIELKVVIDPSAGSVEVRINGTPVLTASSLNTRNSSTSTWTSFRLGLDGSSADIGIGPGPSREFEYDDLYVLDGSGAAPWNTFLGDCRVDPCYPTAEGTTIGWTPLSGTDNALMVDETAPDDDTTYNSSAGIATDTFVTQNAPSAGSIIYGVQHCINMKKSDSGLGSVAPVIRHGSTDYVGSNINPSTSYGYGLGISQTNPGTSAQWTESDFNAAEFGYKRTV